MLMLSEYENNLNVPLPSRYNKRGSIKLHRDNVGVNPKEPNVTREMENGEQLNCCNTATNLKRNSANQEISVIENDDI
jgi:hypothetical protein